MKTIMKKVLSVLLALAVLLVPMTAMAALGDDTEPWQLPVAMGMMDRLAVNVEPLGTQWVQAADANGTVTVGYATGAYEIYYGRMPVYPETESGNFTAELALQGFDTFSIYNPSETDSVVVYMTLTAGGPVVIPEGTWDNPKVIETLGAQSTTVEAGTEGYYYTWTAPSYGKVNVSMTDEEGWQYQVNKTPADEEDYGSYYSGDIHDYVGIAPYASASTFSLARAAETSATITFDDSSKAEWSSQQQLWQENGITVTNNKASSTTAIDTSKKYSNPARFYKGSELIVEYPGMTKLVIDHTGVGSKYYGWANSFSDNNATAEENADITTITFATPVDSFTFNSLSIQCRVYSITVYAGGESGGETTDPVDPPVEEPTFDPSTATPAEIVDAAYALGADESFDKEATLTGVITAVNTPYSAQYGNITVTIAVEGKEDKPIQCYRLAGEGADDITIDDVITVTGILTNYKGNNVQFSQGCTLDAVVKGDFEVVIPEDPKEIVDAAFALEEGTALPYEATLTGEVVSIDTPYDETYGNVSVIISVEGTDGMQDLLCYRMKGEGADTIEVGDTITVTGNIKNYYGTIEFDAGCVVSNIVKNPVEPENIVTRSEEIIVYAGDKIQVMVNTYDPANPWSAPAGTINWSFDFEEISTFIVDDASAVIGQEFDVAIKLENNPGIVSLKLDVAYDADVLELVGAKDGDFAATTESKDDAEDTDDIIGNYTYGELTANPFAVNWISALSDENITTNGVVATLTFKVKDTVTCGASTPITVTYDAENVFDKDFNNVAIGVMNAEVAIDHTLTYVEEIYATCTESGVQAHDKCEVCGKLFWWGMEVSEEDLITEPYHDRTWVEAVPATCTETGIAEHYVCPCGQLWVFSDETWEFEPVTAEDLVLETIDHTAAEERANVKDATCTEAGYTGDVVCSECGEVIEAGTEIPTLDHTAAEERANVKPATCTDAGYTGDVVCSECGIVMEAGTETPATGTDHEFSEEIPAQAATCTEDGWNAYKVCTLCGYSTKEIIPALGHTEEVVNAKSATCTEAGYTGDTVCSVCEETIKAGEEISALGHTEEVVNARPATCTEAGYTGDTVCSVCEETIKAGEEIPALNHTEEVVNARPATCTEAGYTGDTVCSVCEETIKAGEEIPALDHTAAEAVEENRVDATCTAEGSYDLVVKCSVCGEEISRETMTIEKIAHTEVIEGEVDATCSTVGSTGDTVCSVCGEVIKAAEEIAKLAHTPAEELANVKDATCTEAGYTGDKVCSVCGEVIEAGTEIAALGHKPEFVEKVDPTLDAEGKEAHYVCTVCGALFADENCETPVTEEDLVIEKLTVAYGDVNADGTINNKDLGLLMQYLNNWDVTVNELAADANGDGTVNNKDYGLLMQFLNNWNVVLGPQSK